MAPPFLRHASHRRRPSSKKACGGCAGRETRLHLASASRPAVRPAIPSPACGRRACPPGEDLGEDPGVAGDSRPDEFSFVCAHLEGWNGLWCWGPVERSVSGEGLRFVQKSSCSGAGSGMTRGDELHRRASCNHIQERMAGPHKERMAGPHKEFLKWDRIREDRRCVRPRGRPPGKTQRPARGQTGPAGETRWSRGRPRRS